MTPQFITPCYVRVDDKDKFTEVTDKLYSLGYLLGQHSIDMLDNIIITYPDVANTFCAGSVGMFDEIDLDGRINCGTDIDLFLALAGMRDDTDKGQWFKKGSLMFKADESGNISIPLVHYLNSIPVTRATTAEIVKHFNKKSK